MIPNLKSILFTHIIACCFASCGQKVNHRAESSTQRDSFTKAIGVFSVDPNCELAIHDAHELSLVLRLLKLDSIYADAKWKTYCVVCMDTIFYKNMLLNKNDYAIVGEIELSLRMLTRASNHYNCGYPVDYIMCFTPFAYSDTLSITQKTMLLPSGKRNYYHVFFNLYYSKNSAARMPLAFEYYDVLSAVDSTADETAYCLERHRKRILFNPFQPEVIKHVRENASKINPWFFNEAKRRGMFDSVKYSPAWVEKGVAANKKKKKDCIDP